MLRKTLDFAWSNNMKQLLCYFILFYFYYVTFFFFYNRMKAEHDTLHHLSYDFGSLKTYCIKM